MSKEKSKEELERTLCEKLCADIRLIERPNRKWMISVPFSYPDGDRYSIYLDVISPGKIRISDGANTMMRLSYDTPNVSKFFKGGIGKLMDRILRENDIQESDGNFYVDTPVDKISPVLFRFTQALSQIYDLSYLSRDRKTSTFYKDFEILLERIVKNYDIVLEKDYLVPGLENTQNYPIDYALQRNGSPNLFLFGVPGVDKAKLVTITLQYLFIHRKRTSTLIVFENQEEISSNHLGRLMDANVGGSLVSSIHSTEAIEQNIERGIAVN